ncbi:MAG: hypothetical protein J5586_08965 [Clostridia bacterium]|nr:hypothetical protein [Clostridia bacterium]
MSKKHYGKCALCGKIGTLSFEHIPPECAGNDSLIKAYSFKDLLCDEKDRLPWETEGLHYEQSQNGHGKYSLCEKCNSLTGHLYGKEYQKFDLFALRVVSENKDPNKYCAELKKAYPNRFIKQVLSLFCSIEPEYSAYDELRSFVLDKHAKGLDKDKFRLTMFFVRNEILMYSGNSNLISCDKSKDTIVNQLVAYPLGFLLYLNPSNQKNYEGTDITLFADYDYDHEDDIVFPIDIREVNTGFPLDFRTKDELLKAINTEKVKEPS